MNVFSELKRRNVYKVAAAYAVIGWLLVQVATQVFPFFDIPNWAVRLVVLAIVIGFPIALVIAWAFELTPEGLKRTEDVDLGVQGRRKSHAWIYIVIVGAAFSIGLFFMWRSTAKYKSKPEDLKTVSHQLGVATVLEGSVQKAADKVRVNVQLIDAGADSHLWAKTYDRDIKDVFAVESEVAQG